MLASPVVIIIIIKSIRISPNRTSSKLWGHMFKPSRSVLTFIKNVTENNYNIAK